MQQYRKVNMTESQIAHIGHVSVDERKFSQIYRNDLFGFLNVTSNLAPSPLVLWLKMPKKYTDVS